MEFLHAPDFDALRAGVLAVRPRGRNGPRPAAPPPAAPAVALPDMTQLMNVVMLQSLNSMNAQNMLNTQLTQHHSGDKGRRRELSISDTSDGPSTPKRPRSSAVVTSPAPPKGGELRACFVAFANKHDTILEPFLANFERDGFYPQVIPHLTLEQLKGVTDNSIKVGDLVLLKVFCKEWWARVERKRSAAANELNQ